MTPDEIRTHPMFAKLTENLQKFVEELMRNGNDKLAAAHAAWNCKSDESARTLANRALKREDVAYLVERYFGLDPERVQFTRNEALAFAARKARHAQDDKLALEYLKLIVAMNGWQYAPAKQDAPPPPEEPKDDSGDEFSLE